MGNKPFKIAVQLDQQECEAGQVITGKVYLSIGRLCDASSFRGIHLLLHGVERSDIAAAPGTLEYDRRRRAGRPFVETSSHTIVHVDYPLVDLTGISRGQYEYPFQLPLRDDLPASVKCALGDRDKSFCEIKYTLTAYVVHTGPQNSDNDSILRHDLKLTMKGLPSNPIVGLKPIRTDTTIFPITSCWFWSQGHIALGWSSSCSVALPGDNVHVRVWGENQSKLNVEYISVKWMERVTWHSERADGQRSQKSAPRLLAEQRQSPQHAHWMAGEDSTSLSSGRSTHQALLHDDDRPSMVFTLKLPRHARQTFTGRLLQVQHYLVVSVHTSGGYSSSTPESTFPVSIRTRHRTSTPSAAAAPTATANAVPTSSTAVSPSAPSDLYDTEQEPLVQAHALPEDWNPTQADLISLPLASAVVVMDPIPVTPPRTTTTTRTTAEPVVVLAPPAAAAASAAASLSTTTPQNDPVRAKVVSETTTSSSEEPQKQDSLDQLATLVADCPENLAVILQDPQWTQRVQGLSPREFCHFVQTTTTTSRTGDALSSQTTTTMVTHALAEAMGSSFQTKHILACLWMVSPDHRMSLLRTVSPFASDIASKRFLIEEELNQEELTVFQAVLS